MTRNDTIALIVKSCTGATVTETSTEVWCAEKSVTRSEFYAAYQVGLNVKAQFEVALDDWKYATVVDTSNLKHEPTEAVYDNVRYNILRSYKHDGIVEVMCG